MVYHFGQFLLNAEKLELLKDGKPISVEPQVFNLLICLIKNRDRVVTKDELIETVWGGRIVTDGALNTRINAVRRAVDDDGRRQAVIKTFQRRGFRFVAETTDEKETQTIRFVPVSDKPSIAVLPFNNLSDDSEQEYFADGITEDLITGLSKLSGLLVIGRNSSFFYKGKIVDYSQVKKELGVNFALQGSIRKAGNRIRISARLIELGSDHLVWANNFDGTLDDVFELQDEITGKILSALPVQLAYGEQRRLTSQYTNNAEAHDWFMRGRIRYREPGPKANAEAHGMFDRALVLDPNFAWAMAIRSYVRFHAWFFKWNTADDAFSNALVDAENASLLDPNLAAAHSYLGWIHMWGNGHEQALAEHEKALDLDPNFAEGYVWYSSTLIYSGRPELAIEPMERALRLDPHHPPNFLINFGNMYLQLGRYDEAQRHLESVMAMAPDFPVTYMFLAAVRAAAGDVSGACKAGDEILMRIPSATASELGNQFPYANPEHLSLMVDGLRIAGLPD